MLKVAKGLLAAASAVAGEDSRVAFFSCRVPGKCTARMTNRQAATLGRAVSRKSKRDQAQVVEADLLEYIS